MTDCTRTRIEELLAEEFPDRVYSVEENVVWVSGMNSNCVTVAERMAKMLTYTYDIPTSPTYDDDAVQFGGVQFNWGEIT